MSAAQPAVCLAPQPKLSAEELAATGTSAASTLERPRLSLSGACRLTFCDLAFSAQLPGGEKKVILEPCSGHFEAGELVALMGPSGSGKTTLLDMLAMKKTAPFQGKVLVNGHPQDRQLFTRIAAYVGQEDVMPAHWKVREAVLFNASLKRSGASAKACRAAADTLLEAFDLQGVAETYIGGPQVRGISGGQRRRVTLARGVAAQASILFADEPTSGLSATDAELCVKALRVVAKQLNVLVVVVIHQPRKEVAQLFDTLVLLTSNPGRVAYMGPMQDALAYMRSVVPGLPAAPSNPADLFLDLVTPGADSDASAELVEAFEKRQLPGIRARCEEAAARPGQTQAEILEAACEAESKSGARGTGVHKLRVSAYAVPFHRQLGALLRRKLLITARNPEALALQIFFPLLMGNVLGAVFQGVGHQQSLFVIMPFLFILLTMLGLQSLPALPLFVAERGFMKYETSERLYRELAAMLVSFLVDAPLGLAVALGQASIIYAYTGLAFEYYWTIMGWVLLLYFFYDSIFACMAAVAPDAQQALSQAVPLLTVFMLFNGFIVSKASAPVWLRWIFFVSPNAYALQGIVSRMAPDFHQDGGYIVTAYHYSSEEDGKGVAVIVLLTLLFRVLQVVALKRCNNVQR